MMFLPRFKYSLKQIFRLVVGAIFPVVPCFLITFFPNNSQAQAVKTTIVQVNGQYTFVRNGSPYYVKGAGGHKQLDVLVDCGGNSIRTWSLDDAQEILDNAQKHGLTVMMGLWVGHERHGFDYNDVEAVQRQFDRFKQAIPKYKDHPALLCWSVGNEVDLFYSNTKVWDAVQDIAKMIHELDPNHPTTTVTAGLDSTEVYLIKTKCPDIDFYSVNTYGDIGNVPTNISKFGWTGPYMITEWGPNGHWEVSKTTWGAPIEQTSTEKAATYKERLNKYILDHKSHCMGSYVFLWGQKQETTSSWYGLFNENGERTESIDMLQEAWTGKAPENRAAAITYFDINGKKLGETNTRLEASQMHSAKIKVSDPEQDKLKISWAIYPESTDIKAGGDKEAKPIPVLGLKMKKNGEELSFEAPKTEGAYRLFVTITDKGGKVTYANYPFFVAPNSNPKQPAIQLKKQQLDIN
ncbi:MAG: hypothetical protein KDC92_02720 [Bacteroidetes bacterium]|nr:hypothetical protein [Bacteroidota bacterium]